MKRAWCVLAACSLLLLGCGGEDGMPQDQITPWEDLETSVTESPEAAADDEVGTVEQSIQTCIAGPWPYGGTYGISDQTPNIYACINFARACGYAHQGYIPPRYYWMGGYTGYIRFPPVCIAYP